MTWAYARLDGAGRARDVHGRRGFLRDEQRVDRAPPVEPVELPEAEAHADDGYDDRNHHESDAADAERGHRHPFISWMVLPPSTTIVAPVT